MTNHCLQWLKSFVASLDDSGHYVECEKCETFASFFTFFFGPKKSENIKICQHWLESFVASLDDSGHNVEWLGGQLLTT